MHLKLTPALSVLSWAAAIALGVAAVVVPEASLLVPFAVALSAAVILTAVTSMHREAVTTRRVLWATRNREPEVDGNVINLRQAYAEPGHLWRR